MQGDGLAGAFWKCRRCQTPNPVAAYLTNCLACGASRPAGPSGRRRRPWSSDFRRPVWRWRMPGVVPGPRPERGGEGRGAWRRLGMACWAYAGSILALGMILWLAGDRWWFATLALFGPRWIWAAPMVLLVPAAAARRPAALGPLAAALLLVLFPLMGFRASWRRSTAGGAGGFTVRVLTCNIEGKAADPEALGSAIDGARPDLVLFQEGRADRLPGRLREEGWWIRGTLASRHPVIGSERMDAAELGADGSVERFDVALPGAVVHVFNVHLESPRDGLDAVIHDGPAGAPALREVVALRARQSAAASGWIGPCSGPILIAGDFNMPVESAIYRRYWGGYSNAFSESGFGFGYSKFTRWHGIRIDHVLGGPGWRPFGCRVGPDVGSDHRPVVADFEWVGPPG